MKRIRLSALGGLHLPFRRRDIAPAITASPVASRRPVGYPSSMSGVLADLPEVFDQESFNLERWSELEREPFLAAIDCRIETDRYGQVILVPPPGFEHSNLQGLIFETLRDLMGSAEGRVRPECPVSTSGGVKGIDLVWIFHARVAEGLRQNVLTIAPEICIEVLSPRNTRAEMEEKKRLYFEVGASEVWIASTEGEVAFFNPDGEMDHSALCPGFPSRLVV